MLLLRSWRGRRLFLSRSLLLLMLLLRDWLETQGAEEGDPWRGLRVWLGSCLCREQVVEGAQIRVDALPGLVWVWTRLAWMAHFSFFFSCVFLWGKDGGR